MKLTRTNRPFGLIIKLSQAVIGNVFTVGSALSRTCNCQPNSVVERLRYLREPISFWWLYREGHTRSHPEHGS
jgi:hypothetical protein